MYTLEHVRCYRAQSVPCSYSILPGTLWAVTCHQETLKSGETLSDAIEVLAGHRAPVEGRILVDEVPIVQDPQGYALLSASALWRWLPLSGTPSQWLQTIADLRQTHMMGPAAVHYWGIAGLMDRPWHALCLRERCRVAMAGLMCTQACLWWIDLPLARCSEEEQNLWRACVQIRCEHGGTVAYHAEHAGTILTPQLMRYYWPGTLDASPTYPSA